MQSFTFLKTVGCVLALTASPATSATLTTDLSVVATDSLGLQPFVDAFRGALGDNNGNNPENADPAGRRQIDWDAAPDVVSDPNAFPGDFFNANVAPRARGIEFQETGTTDGFSLSSTAASGEPVRFGSPDNFIPFSEERLFAPTGGNTLDVVFFDPATQVDPALTRGLGIVFSDVERFGSTTLTLFGIDGSELLSRTASAGGSGELSFLGLIFDEAVIARASLTVGDAPFDESILAFDQPTLSDLVVMDDFIFGEPVPAVAVIPLPATLPMLFAGLAAFGLMARRRKS